jgi:aminomethyltransferase
VQQDNPEPVEVEAVVELGVVFFDEAANDGVDFSDGHANPRAEVGGIDVGLQHPFTANRTEDEFYVAMAQTHFIAILDEIVRELQPFNQTFRHADRKVDLPDKRFFADHRIDDEFFAHGGYYFHRRVVLQVLNLTRSRTVANVAGEMASLKRTPLYRAELECGAKMTEFGGWEMPVMYSSIVEEHHAVRQRVGLFDISHMGEVLVAGPNAETVLNRLFTNDVRKVEVGQAQYTLMCNERGGVIDDLIIYRVEPTVFLLVVNAGKIENDFAWMNSHASGAAVFDNQSDRTAALALQGPLAAKFLENSARIAPFHVERETVFGRICWVARTGYTGEDGFEILCDAGDAVEIWTELLEFGAEFGILPCGLGARDTLRLEACLPLHGQDLTEETTPIEAGLTRFVSFDKGEFIGRPVLVEQKEKGVARTLVGFKMAGKSPPPRTHYAIVAGGRKVGEVTSGTQSLTLGVGIGLGYVEAGIGPGIEIEVRGNLYPAKIEKKPFYKRGQ